MQRMERETQREEWVRQSDERSAEQVELLARHERLGEGLLVGSEIREEVIDSLVVVRGDTLENKRVAVRRYRSATSGFDERIYRSVEADRLGWRDSILAVVGRQSTDRMDGLERVVASGGTCGGGVWWKVFAGVLFALGLYLGGVFKGLRSGKLF